MTIVLVFGVETSVLIKVDFCILCGSYPILPLHLHKEIPWGGSSTAVGLNLSFLTDKRLANDVHQVGKG